MENPLPASIVTLLRHLSMENVIDVMIVTDVMDLPKPVNSVSKNVLLTKRTRMENYSVGYVPCLIKELWFAPNNRIPHDIVEFSNLKKTKKKKKKGKKKYILVFSHIPKFGQKLLFFSCLDENYLVAGQEFYSCPVDDHLQGKNRILAQLPYNV